MTPFFALTYEQWSSILTPIAVLLSLVAQQMTAHWHRRLVAVESVKNEATAERATTAANKAGVAADAAGLAVGQAVAAVGAAVETASNVSKKVDKIQEMVNGPLLTALKLNADLSRRIALASGTSSDLKAAADAQALVENKLESSALMNRIHEAVTNTENPNILVVEDTATDLELHLNELTKAGHPAQGVTTAKGAVELLKEKQFGLCFLDLGLPDALDPVELVNRIARAAPGMPIAVLTGTAPSEEVRLALSKKIIAFLLKPLSREQVEAMKLLKAVPVKGATK